MGSLYFADDIALMSTTKTGAKQMLVRLDEFCVEWNLTINLKKTKIVEFSSRRKRLARREEFRLNGQMIEIVDDFNYLGIKFSRTGDWKTHIKIEKLQPGERTE